MKKKPMIPMEKITIRVPLNLIDKIDFLIQYGKSVTRSDIVRTALYEYLENIPYQDFSRKQAEFEAAQPEINPFLKIMKKQERRI